jgi:hypothetical protein
VLEKWEMKVRKEGRENSVPVLPFWMWRFSRGHRQSADAIVRKSTRVSKISIRRLVRDRREANAATRSSPPRRTSAIESETSVMFSHLPMSLAAAVAFEWWMVRLSLRIDAR